MLAIKGNKQLTIPKELAEEYRKDGFDIAEEVNGKLKIVSHGVGKTVPIDEYERLEGEIADLRKQLAKAKPDEKAETKAKPEDKA